MKSHKDRAERNPKGCLIQSSQYAIEDMGTKKEYVKCPITQD